MHSVTKYLGGHSDVVMGALMTKDAETDAALRTLQNNVGAVPGPMDCFIAIFSHCIRNSLPCPDSPIVKHPTNNASYLFAKNS